MTTTTAPAGLAGSVLVRSGGWRIVPLVAGRALSTLAAEARARHRYATESVVDAPRDDDPGRGHPDRRLLSAPGGPALRALYASPILHGMLGRLTGAAWQPSGLDASYSYYCAPGHYLGLHRDVVICDLAVIACIADDGVVDGTSGVLHVYPRRAADSLADIRADRRGGVPVALLPGVAVVLFGGVVPHEVRPVGRGRCRVVAPMCFRPASSTARRSPMVGASSAQAEDGSHQEAHQ